MLVRRRVFFLFFFFLLPRAALSGKRGSYYSSCIPCPSNRYIIDMQQSAHCRPKFTLLNRAECATTLTVSHWRENRSYPVDCRSKERPLHSFFCDSCLFIVKKIILATYRPCALQAGTSTISAPPPPPTPPPPPLPPLRVIPTGIVVIVGQQKFARKFCKDFSSCEKVSTGFLYSRWY